MAHEPDYDAMAARLKINLEAEPGLDGTVIIEPPFTQSADLPMPLVGIHFGDESHPPGEQKIANGMREMIEIDFVITCVQFSTDGLATAKRLRNVALAKVLSALMRDRTLGGLCKGMILAGARRDDIVGQDGGFFAFGNRYGRIRFEAGID